MYDYWNYDISLGGTTVTLNPGNYHVTEDNVGVHSHCS